MAVLNLVDNLFSIGNFGARIPRNRVVSSVGPRFIQASSKQEAEAACDKAKEAIKQGANEAKKTGENIKDEATSTATASQVNQNTKKMAAKAKDSMQNAWDSAKETAKKAKDTVLGKADESKEAIKENAEKINQSFNTKN